MNLQQNFLAIISASFLAMNATGENISQPSAPNTFLEWAPRPPMGWNSWDAFGCTVTEDLTKANTDYMAEKLASHGWQYIVVDIQWYEPQSKGFNYARNPIVTMDEWGRLWPVTNKFPGSADGKGFKPLADYVHGKRLKFGVHLLRGIPREAVKRNTPILGTSFHAADIADTNSKCAWNPDMFGVNMTKPGAQEYYDSVFKLFAEWDIDFVKVDDLSRPYHQPEIEAIRKAIDRTGRPMVFSTSPGETSLSAGESVSTHANMWRVSDDFWDSWKPLKEQFARLDKWTPFRAPGHWPDADMLPLGNVRAIQTNGWTHFTHDEQITVMTLWSIARSPLIMGGNLPKNDAFTLSLLTNDEVLVINQISANNHQLFRNDDLIAWTADLPDSFYHFVALFNAKDNPQYLTNGEPISVQFNELGLSGTVQVRDLWAQKDLGEFNGGFTNSIPPHGAGLFRLVPVSTATDLPLPRSRGRGGF